MPAAYETGQNWPFLRDNRLQEPRKTISYLQLLKSEAAAQTCPAVVLDGATLQLDSSSPSQSKKKSGLTNGQRTIGRSLSTGRGARAAAFARRARRRVTFLPGCFRFPHVRKCVPISSACCRFCGVTDLVEVAPHTPLPVLAEV